MPEYAPEEWGDTFAEIYDEWRTDEQARATVEFLVGLAGDGPVLELGVGTGRLTVGMAAHGLQVHGVDASARMLDLLTARADKTRIHPYRGDITDLRCLPDGTRFSLAYLTASTSSSCPTRRRRCSAWQRRPTG